MAAVQSFLECKRKFTARSDRVKSLEFHPREPWLLAALYNGHVYIWNYNTQSLAKDIEVTNFPVRCGRFVARKEWVITGADDMKIRAHNYNTLESVVAFEAHQDYIRSLAVHPTQPYVISSSDDMLIKLWDWEKNWANTQIFEGHNHYVMMVVFNPKDTNTFASASLDHTIKVWGLGSATPYFTLEGHEQGVNCVSYYHGGERPYLVSGGDDRSVRVWDYQNKSCVQVLTGHTHNVSSVEFHPTLPVLLSGGEDGSVRLWNSSTYRLITTLHYRMERIWTMTCMKTSNKIAIGYDEGAVLIKMGSEEPAVSMDRTGKIVWSKHNEIKLLNVKYASGAEEDGEKLPLPPKDLGNCEMYPNKLIHNSNGRFVVAQGDGEYVIYTALKWRNKAFGRGLEFVWAKGTGDYAVLESKSKIKMYKNFKEEHVFRPNFTAEGIHTGELLGIRSQEFICFYDWDSGMLIHQIDVSAKSVIWSDSGELVTIASEDAFYILRYQRDSILERLAAGEQPTEEGFENAFTLEHRFEEKVRTGSWVGACFVYTSTSNRLNYVVGQELVTIAHLDRQQYLLGYLPKTNRVYLIDKSLSVCSYTLHLSIVNYQTAVLNSQLDLAASILPEIPLESRNRIARFLEAQGYKEEALKVATDPDLRFELAVQLNHLQEAFEIAKGADSEQKWHTLSDLAIQQGRFGLAQKCMFHAEDLGGLLLLYASTGHANALGKLAERAHQRGKHNLAFAGYLLLQRLDDCLEILLSTNRIPEAAFFARTYLPSQVSRVVTLWKQDLQTKNKTAAESLADPAEYPNLFPDFDLALKAERFWNDNKKPLLASSFTESVASLDRDLIEEVRAMETAGELNLSDRVAAQPGPADEIDAAPAAAATPTDTESVPEQTQHTAELPASAAPIQSSAPASPVSVPSASPASPTPAQPTSPVRQETSVVAPLTPATPAASVATSPTPQTPQTPQPSSPAAQSTAEPLQPSSPASLPVPAAEPLIPTTLQTPSTPSPVQDGPAPATPVPPFVQADAQPLFAAASPLTNASIASTVTATPEPPLPTVSQLGFDLDPTDLSSQFDADLSSQFDADDLSSQFDADLSSQFDADGADDSEPSFI